jgi:hypothetical protein
MRPVDQTLFGFEEGNCFAACLASILELPLEAVPNFCANKEKHWEKEAQDWLIGHFGLSMFTVRHNEVSEAFRDCYCIVAGPSPRGIDRDKEMHSCVWKNGEIVHDPHPDKTGLPEITEMSFIISADPSLDIQGSYFWRKAHSEFAERKIKKDRNEKKA